jgi:hypothetical protein
MAETQVERNLPNDRWDGGWVAEANEWKPRPRDRVIGGIEWLARMSDKARAKARGTIGAYIYPCPADRRLLEALQIDAELFQQIALQASNDDELVEAVRKTSPAIRAGTFHFTRRPAGAQTPPGGQPGQPV